MSTIQERLISYVHKTRTLTRGQLRGWNWLYSGKAWESPVITGVVVPADGSAPSHLVTVAEMERAPA